MRVVVTRPEGAGQRTAARLRERGHDPVLLPLTEAIHEGDAALQAIANRPALMAITSAEAIRALQTVKAGISEIGETPLFAVGDATAKTARDAGFHIIFTGNSDGRALADLIAETLASRKMPVGPLLYLAGKPRDTGFEDRLSALGIDVRTVEVYEMQPVAWEAADIEARLTNPKPDAVLLYSTETARRFFAVMSAFNLSPLLEGCTFICISEKVLAGVPDAYIHKAVASRFPSETAMFDLLDRLAGT